MAGRHLTTDYLGGLFSLDGCHPTNTGHALIANEFIDAINARFDENVAPVDIHDIARHDPAAEICTLTGTTGATLAGRLLPQTEGVG